MLVNFCATPFSKSKRNNVIYRCLKEDAITEICNAYKDLTKGKNLNPKLLSYDCFIKPNANLVCPIDEYSTLACVYTNKVTGKLRQLDFRIDENQWRISKVIDKLANNGELIKKYNKYGDMYSIMYKEPNQFGNGSNLFEFTINQDGNAKLGWKHY